MSKRIDKSWLVFTSIENREHDRCVDLFSRPDGTFGFEEFRRDVEDQGEWTPVTYYSGAKYLTRSEAETTARQTIPWFAERSGSNMRSETERRARSLEPARTAPRYSTPSPT